MFLVVSLLAAALTTQVGAQVRTEAGVLSYVENQDQDVPIALPTDRYSCVRRPVLHSNNRVVVMITCKEGAREAFVIGTSCSVVEPDENMSMITVNVSKTDKPNAVVFNVGCRTLPGSTFL